MGWGALLLARRPPSVDLLCKVPYNRRGEGSQILYASFPVIEWMRAVGRFAPSAPANAAARVDVSPKIARHPTTTYMRRAEVT